MIISNVSFAYRSRHDTNTAMYYLSPKLNRFVLYKCVYTYNYYYNIIPILGTVIFLFFCLKNNGRQMLYQNVHNFRTMLVAGLTGEYFNSIGRRDYPDFAPTLLIKSSGRAVQEFWEFEALQKFRKAFVFVKFAF